MYFNGSILFGDGYSFYNSNMGCGSNILSQIGDFTTGVAAGKALCGLVKDLFGFRGNSGNNSPSSSVFSYSSNSCPGMCGGYSTMSGIPFMGVGLPMGNNMFSGIPPMGMMGGMDLFGGGFQMPGIPGLSLPGSTESTKPTEKTEASQETNAKVASNSGDDNMGIKFNNWTNEVTKSAGNGETAEDFAFVGPEYEQAVTGHDNEKAGSIYTKGALTLARDSIKVTDKNNDGKISYNEFLSKEINDYAEACPDESIEDSLTGIEESSTTAFKNIDLDQDGKIDEKEQAAMYAAMDQNLETGDINGKIKQEEYINFTTDLSDASKESSSIRKKLEGVYKLLFGKKED